MNRTPIPTLIPPPAAALALAAILMLAAPLAAQPPKLGVSPSTFNIEIGSRPVTQSFRVFNYDDDAFDAEITVHNWDLDEDNKTRILPPTEQSLDQWIVVNPVRFTIPPRSSQVVRFSIRPRVEPAPGEHRAMIYLISKPAAGKELGVRFNLRFGLAVYGHVGEVTRRGTLHAVDVDASSASFDVSSEGSANVRFDGQYAVWPADAYPGAEATTRIADPEAPEALPEPVVTAGGLPNKPVLPGTRRRIPLRLAQALPPGDYVLDLNGSLGETEIDMAVAFSVSAPDHAAPAAE